MSFQLVFTRLADEEYDHAIDWYLAAAPHDVERFEARFNATVEIIRQRPLLPRIAYRELRNVKTHVFLYHVWYRIVDYIDLIEVVAVPHDAQSWARLDRR